MMFMITCLGLQTLNQWNGERFARNDVNGLHGTIGTVNGTLNGLHGTIRTENGMLNSLHGTIGTLNGTLNSLHGTIRTENGWNALAAISKFTFRKPSLFIIVIITIYISIYKP
jgi:hypothetical protein